MQPRTRRSLYATLKWTEISALSASAFIGPSLKFDLVRWKSWSMTAGTALEAIQQNAWWLLLVCGAAVAVAKGGRRHLGEPWAWDGIQNLLDEIRRHVVRADHEDPAHHHRVTLFKKVRWCFAPSPVRHWYWPWGTGHGPSSGWLVSVARSGHTTLSHKATFLAPDDADNAEGIAGQTWSRKRTVHLSSLPEVGAASTDAELVDYAKRTWTSPELVRKYVTAQKVPARSFLGIPVLVQGKMWGVIVVDSRRPKGTRKTMNAVTTNLIDVLSNLARRA